MKLRDTDKYEDFLHNFQVLLHEGYGEIEAMKMAYEHFQKFVPEKIKNRLRGKIRPVRHPKAMFL